MALSDRSGGTVFVVNADEMGRGDSGLGAKLLSTFLHTLATLSPKPDAIAFYNSAVRLLGAGSTSLEALRQLEDAGVDLLACVTCLEFFELTGMIEVGQVSNMREIVQRTMAAAKVITI
jgi:selenium metabolism protein YedF